MTGDVFISYDLAEAGYVEALARHLTAAGLPVWYEREIGGEQRWALAADQLRASAAVLVVMTPGAEQSPWVAGQLDFARQLGKPILALLLRGNVFASLGQVPHENVPAATLPSAAFVAALRGLLPHPPASPPAPAAAPPALAPPSAQPAPAPAWAPDQSAPAWAPGQPAPAWTPDQPPPAWTPGQPAPAWAAGPPQPNSNRGLLIALGVIALVGVLVVAGIAGLLIVTHKEQTANLPWPQRAAAIPGVHDYLASNPEWFVVGATGNHARGILTYPTNPPVGGTHNPLWQNCMGDVYPAAIPKEQAVHSLEHGAVWVTYRPDLPKDQVDRLAGKVRDRAFLFLSPYPGLDQPISLQAWGYQLKVDNAKDSRIDDFIEALRQNATQEPQATCSNGATDPGTAPLDFP